MDESSFRIWDSENYGLLDAFEIFSGLIIFAKAPFEDKLRFLFEIFDMNETGIMDLTELEFLLNTSVFSLFKIKNIKEEVDEDEISSFVEKNFVNDTKLDFSLFFKWINKNKYIWRCMKSVGQHTNFITNENNNFIISTIDAGEEVKEDEETISVKEENKKEVDFSFNSIIDNIKTSFFDKIEFPNNKLTNKMESIEVSTVYGIDVENPNESILLQSDGTQSGKSEKLIYFINNIIVIYYHRLNLQDFYLNHRRKVTALAFSDKEIVASAEGLTNSQINIWDVKTRETLIILKNDHKSKVLLLSFVQNGKYLISVSKTKKSHIFVHDVHQKKLVFSFFEKEEIRTILPLKKSDSNLVQFYLIGPMIIKFIEEEKSSSKLTYKNKYLMISKIKDMKAINCAYVLQEDSSNHLLITGHEDGRLIMWENYTFKTSKKKYKNSIIKIIHNKIGFFLLLDNCQLVIWDKHFNEEVKKIDFSKKKPFSSDFSKYINVLGKSNEIFLLTDQGNIFRYKLQFKSQKNDFTQKIENKLKHQADRFGGVIKIEGKKSQIKLINMNSMNYTISINREKQLLFINTDEKDSNHKLKFSQKITSFDIKIAKQNKHIVVALKNNLIYHLINDKLKNSKQMKEKVKKVMIINKAENLIVLTGNNTLHKFYKKEENYFYNEGSNLIFSENEDNITSLEFLDDTQQIIIISKKQNIYLCDLKLFNKFIQISQKSKINIERINFEYNIDRKVNVMTKFTHDNISALSIANDFYIFSEKNNFLNKIYSKYNFGENTEINNFLINLDKNEIYLYFNNMMVVFKYKVSRKPYSKEVNFETLNPKQNIILDDRMFYSNSFSYIEKTLDQKESAINIICDDFRKTRETIMDEGFTLADKQRYLNRYPDLNLSLEYIYGLEAKENKNHVRYCHFYSPNKKEKDASKETARKLNKEKQIKNLDISKDQMKELIFSKHKYMPYYQKHSSCNRKIIYHFNKYVILYNPKTKKQNQYMEHKNPISCINVSPCKQIIATGEDELFFKARVNVWNAETQQSYCSFTLKLIKKTKLISFSCKGNFLIVVGVGSNKNYCIEIFSWKQLEFCCSAILEKDVINDIIPHNYFNNEFTLMGSNFLQCFSIEGKFLNCKIKHDNFSDCDSEISAVIYFYYLLGDEVDHDYIIGRADGSLGLVTFGKYKTIHPKAHQGKINIINITDIMNDVLIILSAGEDQTICFWDSRLELIKKLNLALCPLWKLNDNINHSANSIDIYACQQNNEYNSVDTEKGSKILLICTKNNEILEIKLSTEFKGIKDVEDENEKFFLNNNPEVLNVSHKNIIIEQILFDYNLVLKFNVDGKNEENNEAFDFIISQNENIMISYNRNTEVIFWDIYKDKFIFEFKCESNIKMIKLFPNKNKIAILMENNVIGFYEFDLVKSNRSDFFIKECVCLKQIKLGQSCKTNYFEFIEASKEGDIDEDDLQLLIFFDINIKSYSANQHYLNFLSFYSVETEEINDKEKLNFIFKGELGLKYENEDEIFKRNNDEALNISVDTFLISEDGIYIYIKLKKTLKNLKHNKITKQRFFEFIYDIRKLNSKPITKIDKNITFKRKLDVEEIVSHNTFFSKKKETFEKKLISSKISSKINFEGNLIIGNERGEILLTKNFSKEENTIDEIKKLNKQAKSLSAQVYPINKLMVCGNKIYLFSVSKKDQCICKWKINTVNKNWEFDYNIYSLKQDQYTNLDTYFQKNSNRRKEIHDLKKINKNEKGKFQLILDKVLHRRAFDRFNNLIATLGNYIMFSTNTLICKMHIGSFEKENLESAEFEQEFLMLEDQMGKDFNCPEISTFCLTHDKQKICIGTAEENASLYFWEINSKQFLCKQVLPNTIVVTHLKYSVSGETLIVIALTKNKKQVLFLIERTSESNILSSIEMSYSDPYKIKNVEFFPDNKYKFVTVGHQHISEWIYVGGNLVFKELKLERSSKMEKGGLLNLIQETRTIENKSMNHKNVG